MLKSFTHHCEVPHNLGWTYRTTRQKLTANTNYHHLKTPKPHNPQNPILKPKPALTIAKYSATSGGITTPNGKTPPQKTSKPQTLTPNP
jgi:hypothetical protein